MKGNIEPYYWVKCSCGWFGSSELCPGGEDWFTCPKCFSEEPEEVSFEEINELIERKETS